MSSNGSPTVPKTTSNPILQLIRRAVEDVRTRELPDPELLERFHGRQDQAAFHTLLRRHGPMVLDVCRGVLGNEADAEDAFQATFLILTRKAGSIRNSAALGSWLHGVAYRTALKARARSATRQKHEAVSPLRTASDEDDLSWREVRQALHEELGRLPECYRAPLVLCYLEGVTQGAAAVRLGVAKSTLRKRLDRGRELLRTGLVRRGLGSSALLAVAAWPAAEAPAAVPLPLLASTAAVAAGGAAGRATAGGLVSCKVAALTEGVLKTMNMSKFHTAAVVLLAVAVAGIGTGALAYRSLAAEQPGGARAGQSVKPDDAARISGLIDRLGSNKFAEREKAAQELDRIGLPALDALRRAAQGNDPERRRRAEDLVKKIEEREQAAALLRPKRVHLVYKDTPLPEAVADFQKQSGYELTLSDPAGKLRKRRITLDTGDVTFWQALDQFCGKAGLVEAQTPTAQDNARLRLPSSPSLDPPWKGPGPRPINPQAAAGQRPGGARGIILADGKPSALPADDRTAVRVRAEPARIAIEDRIPLGLRITPEPRLPRLDIVAIDIQKAVGDQGQDLRPVAAGGKASSTPPANRPLSFTEPAAPGGSIDLALFYLKKVAKPATSLKELSGTITVRTRLDPMAKGRAVTFNIPFKLKDVPMP
jgi:RNA polymerase sigma factor (sigma-70 family)